MSTVSAAEAEEFVILYGTRKAGLELRLTAETTEEVVAIGEFLGAISKSPARNLLLPVRDQLRVMVPASEKARVAAMRLVDPADSGLLSMIGFSGPKVQESVRLGALVDYVDLLDFAVAGLDMEISAPTSRGSVPVKVQAFGTAGEALSAPLLDSQPSRQVEFLDWARQRGIRAPRRVGFTVASDQALTLQVFGPDFDSVYAGLTWLQQISREAGVDEVSQLGSVRIGPQSRGVLDPSGGLFGGFSFSVTPAEDEAAVRDRVRCYLQHEISETLSLLNAFRS